MGTFATYGLLCGIGTGIVYIGIIGLMVKWFPDRRGLATGVVAAGYGFGAILTTFPIDTMLKASGYQHTLVVFVAIFAAIGLTGALMLKTAEAKNTGQAMPGVARRRAVSRRSQCYQRRCSG